MATNSKSEPPQTDNPQTDDLTTIVGINETLEQWFRESLKVQTYADLAALSVQKIRSRAKQAGFVLANEELELMLAQAKKLAQASSSSPESNQPTKTKSVATAAVPPKAKEWNEFATFVVCFERKNVGGKEEKRTKIEHRTGIQHMETEEQASWPGIETDEACKWMLKRLGEWKETHSEEEALKVDVISTSTSTTSHSINIEITGVQIFQPPSTDRPQDIFAKNHALTGYVKGEEPLSFAVTFEIIGSGAAEITKRNLEFSVGIHAINLTTYKPIRLCASKPESLKAGVLTYATELDPIALLPGTYGLRVLATIRDGQPIWNHLEIPVLQAI